MSIIRVRKDAKYFSASNEPFNDILLSWESRGLMGYLLSKPNNWEVRVNDLENKGPAGNHKIRRMLAELRTRGYMNRIRITIENNKFDWITEVYESPSQNPNPSKGIVKASGRFPTSGSSTSGRVPDIDITDLPSTDLQEEEGGKPQNIFEVYTQEIGLLTPMIADAIEDWEKDVPLQWMVDAIGEAVKNNARNWKYIEAILKRWKAQGNQDAQKKTNGANNAKRNTNTPAGSEPSPEQDAENRALGAAIMAERRAKQLARV